MYTSHKIRNETSKSVFKNSNSIKKKKRNINTLQEITVKKKIHRNSTNLVQISQKSKSNVIERQTQHVNDGEGNDDGAAKEKHRFSETRTFLATTAFESHPRVHPLRETVQEAKKAE